MSSHRDLSTQTLQHSNTVVLGAGIAGLASAWRLNQAGLPFTLLEQSSHAGGCIRTLHEQGYLLELGPNTFLNSSAELWRLAESVGLKGLKIETPIKVGKRRYIYKKDRLYPAPSGPGILFSSLLSLSGRLRLLKEPFVRPLIDSRRQEGWLDESLASFIARRLGGEVLQTLATPFVSGIYAGDPEKLSVKAVFPKIVEIENEYGSIFKGMKALKNEIKSAGLGSFRAGIGTLPMAIEARIGGSLIKNARVTEVQRLNNGFNILYETDEGMKNIVCDTVICAMPAYSASTVLSDISTDIKKALSEIEYAPIAVIHTGFKRDDVPVKMDGFGFLVPRKNRVRLLGCLWSSSLFEERAPEGYVLLTSFIGGMLDPEATDLTNDDIMRLVQKDLSRTMGIKAPPSFACITRYTHAIPQYNIGHCKRIKRIEDALAKIPGLFLTGSYFTGISVAGTIEHANKAADKAVEYIRRRV